MTKLLALLLIAAVSLGLTVAVADCKNDCWDDFTENKLAYCQHTFPDVQDSLRKACGEAAHTAYKDCLAECKAEPGGGAELKLETAMLFVPDNPQVPDAYVFSVAADGPATVYVTAVNIDGITDVTVRHNGEVIYANSAFGTVTAAQVQISLAAGQNQIRVDSNGTVAGWLSLFVSDVPIADPQDL